MSSFHFVSFRIIFGQNWKALNGCNQLLVHLHLPGGIVGWVWILDAQPQLTCKWSQAHVDHTHISQVQVFSLFEITFLVLLLALEMAFNHQCVCNTAKLSHVYISGCNKLLIRGPLTPIPHLAETTATLHSFLLKWTLIKLLFDALITSSSLLGCGGKLPNSTTHILAWHALFNYFFLWVLERNEGKRKVMTYF